MSGGGSNIFDLSEKVVTVLEEANASPSTGNTALLYTLVLSMQLTRPEFSPEEIANFLYGQILALAHAIKKELR